MLGAKPRQEAVGHVIGIVAGSLAATPRFFLLFLPRDASGARSASALLSERFPMPAAVQWKGVADLIARGIGHLPASAVVAMATAAALAVLLEVLRVRTRGGGVAYGMRRGLLEMGIESNDGHGQGHGSPSKASRKTMVRLKEIAEAAGVSVMTVSKALRDRRDVAVATKARIRALSESMGYVPNLSAMGLRSRTTRMFGLIIPATTDPVYARVQLAIEQNAADQGYDLLFAQSLGMADREEAALRRFLARGVDGIFLSPVQCMPRPTPYLDEVRRRGIPLVVLGHRTPCCEGFANVETDDLAASASATRHLLELGHRRIAFLAGPQASPSAQERLQGYRRALREAGIEGDDRWVFNAGSTIEEGTHAALQWMQEKTDVTAIQAVNDLVAIGAAEALLNQGFRIPQDVSVVGYGNILAAEHFRAPLTTVRQPKLRLGAVAMDLMLSWLKDGKPASRRIPAELIVRASTGKASAG
ncbi:MAG: LacI family DNA-binding transcriptional regulator [Verrucomicrobiota bacterium]|jgi:LacI family transcriptional regulator